MMEEQVILVNEQDEPIGLMNKLEAHEKAILHRAFSVFVLNKNNEIMLQQRAHQKYHSPLLWTNTCCSHQRNGETNIQAGTRRLFEEMGFKTELKELFHFIYKTYIESKPVIIKLIKCFQGLNKVNLYKNLRNLNHGKTQCGLNSARLKN